MKLIAKSDSETYTIDGIPEDAVVSLDNNRVLAIVRGKGDAMTMIYRSEGIMSIQGDMLEVKTGVEKATWTNELPTL